MVKWRRRRGFVISYQFLLSVRAESEGADRPFKFDDISFQSGHRGLKKKLLFVKYC